MIKLSGILEYSMGGFLCLRGFASFKILSAISEPNPEIQRELISGRINELSQYLNRGEYRFFPEVILALNLTDGNSQFDILSQFHDTLQAGKTWNKNIGDFQFNISQNKTKSITSSLTSLSGIDRVNVAHLRFDESLHKLSRIDGNHRLTASNEVDQDFVTPFCLLIFRDPKEKEQYSRALFYNINAKQVPLNLEETLKVILESEDVFSNEKLKTDPSFGWPFYLARQTAFNGKLERYSIIYALIQNSKYTYLLEEFKILLREKILPAADEAITLFCDQLPQIETALQEAQLQAVPQSLAVIGAISYYKLTNEEKYAQFLIWVKKNRIATADGIHTTDLIQIFDKIYENMPKSIFMSMQFSPETQDTYQTVKDVQATLKRENNIDFRIIKVDEHKDGYSDEIYHRIVNGIKDAALVIADLSYGNKNVHHEIGYAQGLGKKVILLYQTRPGIDPKNEIGSNLSMHDQLRYTNQTELRPALLKRIRHFFGIVDEQ